MGRGARPVPLLPSPRATDGTKGGPGQRGSSGDLMLPSAVTLLPTPAVNDMGEGKTVEAWDEWTATMQAKHGNGNGHGKSLSIEAQRLLPTPKATNNEDRQSLNRYGMNLGQALGITPLTKEDVDALSPEDRPREGLRGLRETPDSEAVCERPTRGQEPISQASELLAELREQSSSGEPVGAQLASEGTPQGNVRGVRHDEATALSPHRPRLDERRPDEPADAVSIVSPEAALEGGPPGPYGCCEASRRHGACPWGIYSAAIHQWEIRLGRVAPPPTQMSKRSTPQLNPQFSEFLMGLPAGWVTDVPGITRNEALKVLGNGVVPQQCEVALRFLLDAEVPVVLDAQRLLPTPTAKPENADDTGKRAARVARSREKHGRPFGESLSAALVGLQPSANERTEGTP